MLKKGQFGVVIRVLKKGQFGVVIRVVNKGQFGISKLYYFHTFLSFSAGQLYLGVLTK